MPGTLETTTSSSSSRKSLIERLASLRIQSSSTSPSQTSSKAPESPRYIPRSAQSTITTKSKFYNHAQQQHDSDSNDLLASPTIGRRRKLTSISSTISKNTIKSDHSISSASAYPFDSPKYFPKQKFVEIERNSVSKFPELEEISEVERNHSVREVVTSFIDSFTILNNFLLKSSNSASAKLHLQNLNTSFAALQMDLKAAVSQLNDVTNLNKVISNLNEEINNLNDEISNLKIENSTKVNKSNEEKELQRNNQELEEQLKIALNQISEIKLAFNKEKENVEFLQNYMEEIIQLKDEAEQKILTLEKQLETGTCSNDLLKENENLKDTIKLLEMERKSSKNACEQALKVLDSGLSLEELNQELKLKQAEIEKLKGREQHFKESNEIFQQKLLLLTEENRKLKGQRPLNHY